MVAYDPLSLEAKEDPERFFSELRRSCPVHHHVLPQADADQINASPLVARPTTEFWSVFRYEDCVEILHNPELFSSREGPGPERMIQWSEDGILIFADNPAHLRQRRIASKAFTPRSVRVVEPKMQEIMDDLVDAVADRGHAELLSEISIPMAIRTIAMILGVGSDKVDDFWRWGNAIVSAFGRGTDAAAEQFMAIQELFEYFGEQIDARREMVDAGGEASDDLLSALIVADYNGSRFTDEELKIICMQFVTAGFETASTAIASGIHLLCAFPEERRKLEEDPGLIENAVEEVLRIASPLEGLFRTAVTDTEIAGVEVPAGAKIRVVYASANRDEKVFSDPDVFRIGRDAAELRKHIAFGSGNHICPGAALARAELKVALSTLLRRLPGLEVDREVPPARNPVLIINGFRALPIRWDPARALARQGEPR
jgi:cytochrome P450